MKSSSVPEERAQFTVAELLARYGEATPSPGRRHRRVAEHPDATVGTTGQPVTGEMPVTPPLFAGQTPMSRAVLFDGPATERLPRLAPSWADPVIRVAAEPSQNTEEQTSPTETSSPLYQPAQADSPLYPSADADSPLYQPAQADSPLWEWAVMVSQIGIGIVGGAALWLSCEWLWQRIPAVALVVALAMITGLVWVVRRVRRAEDLQTTVIAVLVGLFVTVSPAAVLLVGR